MPAISKNRYCRTPRHNCAPAYALVRLRVYFGAPHVLPQVFSRYGQSGYAADVSSYQSQNYGSTGGGQSWYDASTHVSACFNELLVLTFIRSLSLYYYRACLSFCLSQRTCLSLFSRDDRRIFHFSFSPLDSLPLRCSLFVCSCLSLHRLSPLSFWGTNRRRYGRTRFTRRHARRHARARARTHTHTHTHTHARTHTHTHAPVFFYMETGTKLRGAPSEDYKT